MALELGATRKAFVATGISSDMAEKAAEELATFEGRILTLEGKMNLLIWMVGFNLLLTTGLYGYLAKVALGSFMHAG